MSPRIIRTDHHDGTHSLDVPPELIPEVTAPDATERDQIMRDLLGNQFMDTLAQEQEI